jgi:hypothetical protein
MSTQVGPKFPTTEDTEGSGQPWYFGSPLFGEYTIFAQDSLGPAQSTSPSAYLIAGGFDFSSIPDTAQIVGIQIDVRAFVYLAEPP